MSLFDVRAGKAVIKESNFWVRSHHFSNDGHWLMVTSQTRKAGAFAVLYDLNRFQPVSTNALPALNSWIRFSPDGGCFLIWRKSFESCGGLAHVLIGNGVTGIGTNAFFACTYLTSVTFGTNVIDVEHGAFFSSGLTSLVLPESVKNIGVVAFAQCVNLTNIIIHNGVTNIGTVAFANCTSLTNVTIPNSVDFVGSGAFGNCDNLHSVFFEGNALRSGGSWSSYPNVYYLPGTSGWTTMFAGRPTTPWLLPNPVILTLAPHFGVRTNQFGFVISWATDVSVVVEACTDMAASNWSPVSTNNLVDGWSYFSDPDWTNYPSRIYRVRSE